MKKIIFLIIIGFCLLINLPAQNNSQILVGKTWRITSLKMNDDLFVETPYTCVYTSEILFVNNTTLTLSRPCISVIEQTYNILGNNLIINNTDTLLITRISTTSFETTQKQNAVDENGNVSVILLTTNYEKK